MRTTRSEGVIETANPGQAVLSAAAEAVAGTFRDRAEVERQLGGTGEEGRRRQIEFYLNSLFGEDEGWVNTPVGWRSSYAETGSYKFEQWRNRVYWRWPSDRGGAVEFALDQSVESDVYVCPTLLTEAKRNDANCGEGAFAWADLDGPWSSERSVRVSQILRPRSFLVTSGSGFHLYVALGEFHSPDEIRKVNESLKDALGADAKQAPSSTLRLPGTFNHKPVPLGGDPLPVAVVFE